MKTNSYTVAEQRKRLAKNLANSGTSRKKQKKTGRNTQRRTPTSSADSSSSNEGRDRDPGNVEASRPQVRRNLSLELNKKQLTCPPPCSGRAPTNRRVTASLPRDSISDIGDDVNPRTECSPETDSPTAEKLTTSQVTIAGMFTRMQNELVTNLRDVESRLGGKIADLQEQQLSKNQEIEGLQSMTSTGSGCKGKEMTSAYGKQGRWKALLEKETRYDDLLEDSVVLSKVVAVVASSTVVKISNEEGDPLSATATAVATIAFGKPSKDERKILQEGVGKRHCDFRQSLVLTLLCNVQANTFQTFKASTNLDSFGANRRSAADTNRNEKSIIPSPSEVDTVRCLNGPAISHPEWLRAGFISVKDVEEARIYNETIPVRRGQPHIRKTASGEIIQLRPLKMKTAPANNDIALYGAKKLHSLIGYLLVYWHVYGVSVDQGSMMMRWEHRDAPYAPFSIEDIPKTKLSGKVCKEVDEHNMLLFQQMLSDRLEMVLSFNTGWR